MVVPYWIWYFFYVPVNSFLENRNTPSLWRHRGPNCRSDWNSHRPNFRVEPIFVETVLEKALWILNLIWAISEIALSIGKTIPH